MIVHACLRVVVIGQLWDVGYSLLWLLEDGKANGHVIGCFQVLSICVSEVFLSNVSEELSVKGAKVARDKGILSVTVLMFDAVGYQAREPYIILCGKEVAIDEPRVLPLKHGIE